MKMNLKLEKKQMIGIVAAVIIIIVAIIFLKNSEEYKNLFYFVIGIAIIIGVLPFIISLMLDSSKEKENNEMFLEFSRNLAESVKAGTPISKSIINVKNKFYGTLTPHVQKLGNQIALGIPVKQALETFALDVNSPAVTRAVMMISEAEKAGGEIEKILDSVAKSVSDIEKLKKERRAAIYGLAVQGYIIFLIFIVIMLILEFKILPTTKDIGSISTDSSFFSSGACSTGDISVEEMSRPFLYLLLSQGFFSGLIIGKLSEGSVKAGLKHSFILMILAFLITTGVRAFIG